MGYVPEWSARYALTGRKWGDSPWDREGPAFICDSLVSVIRMMAKGKRVGAKQKIEITVRMMD